MSDGRPKLLTITEAAQELGVSQNTLRKWADTGVIKVVRLPSGYRRFDPAVVAAFRREMGMEG